MRTYNKEYYKKHRKYLSYKDTHMIFALNIKKLLNPKKVLDIGCGLGSTVKALNSIGIDAYGCDKSETLLNFAYKDIKNRLSYGDVCKVLPYRNNEFDLIIMDNVIEHLHNDTAAMLEVVRVLHENGNLIAIVPKHEKDNDKTHINLQKRREWMHFFNLFFRQDNMIIDRKVYFPKIKGEKIIRRIVWNILKENIFVLTGGSDDEYYS